MTTLLYTHPGLPRARPRPVSSRIAGAAAGGAGGALRAEFAALERREAPEAALDDLLRVHPRLHVERLLAAVPSAGSCRRSTPTRCCRPHRARRRCAPPARCVAAVDAVVAGEADNAFCAVRPPGHHAEPDRAMGFCLFNNVAIGALRAREVHGLARVAVVDFDVHHGNGTQAASRTDANLFYALDASVAALSRHRRRGRDRRRQHRQRAAAADVRLGARFAARSASACCRRSTTFAPEMVMISAGFDAHRSDPLAQLMLDEGDYAWVTEQLARDRAASCRRDGWSRRSRAATIWPRSARAPPRMSAC